MFVKNINFFFFFKINWFSFSSNKINVRNEIANDTKISITIPFKGISLQ